MSTAQFRQHPFKGARVIAMILTAMIVLMLTAGGFRIQTGNIWIVVNK
jgi:hypothetical protein